MKLKTSSEVRGWLLDRLASGLGVDRAELSCSADITEYGLDSMLAVELVADLSRLLGKRLSDDLLWTHSRVDDIIRTLEAQGLCQTEPDSTLDPA